MEGERRKKEDGKKKRRTALGPSPIRKRPKRGRGREGKALKRLPQHKVKHLPSKGGLGGAREAAIGQTRWLEWRLLEVGKHSVKTPLRAGILKSKCLHPKTQSQKSIE